MDLEKKKRFLFIVNPISGGKKKENFKDKVSQHLDPSHNSWEIINTEYPGHATRIVIDNLNRFNVFVAVGGDGTVNEVGKALVNTDKIMGIVPVGSGNALGRVLHIPLSVSRALDLLSKGNLKSIDSLTINEQRFFNVAGVGFDAHIAHRFAKHHQRGFVSYAQLVTRDFLKYRSEEYELIVDGKNRKVKAFLITIANSPQYGNNAFIAPCAKIADGFLDVCIMKEFPVVLAADMGVRLFDKRIQYSKYCNYLRGHEVIIRHPGKFEYHIDGEPMIGENELVVKIDPASLNVIHNPSWRFWDEKFSNFASKKKWFRDID